MTNDIPNIIFITFITYIFIEYDDIIVNIIQVLYQTLISILCILKGKNERYKVGSS